MVIGLAFVIPFAILFTLLALNIRLGQGYFAYRYSLIRELRVPRAGVGFAIGIFACAAVWCLAHFKKRLLGASLFTVTFYLWAIWSFWAPPKPMTQQMYGMTSPSCDGAFTLEARGIISIPQYLRAFNERLQTPVEEMKGTRVLSNPPGMTVLAALISRTSIGRDALVRYLVANEDIDTPDAQAIVDALRVGMALCAIWALSGFIAYALGRLYLAPAGAALFAILITFNPCAVEFVPGKDPAQLLTINAMLWAFLAGGKHRSPWLALLGGAIFVIGCTFSLVHIWVAAIVLIATLWDGWASRALRGWTSIALAASAGALCVIAAIYLAIGWNLTSTLLAVAKRWNEIQKTFDMNRGVWYVIGLPIFLLFIGPGTIALAAMSIRRPRLNFGTRLAICTVAAMAFIYFVTGVTYELPRLWVAFLPPLTLGLAIDRPLLRGSAQIFRRPVVLALLLIVVTQIAFTAMHWTLFDVREAEYRLISKRFYQ